MPGLVTKSYGTGDYSWMLNTEHIRGGMTAILDVSAFTKATHYPDGYFRCGTPVNCANRGAVVPWTDTAGAVLGFVGGDFATDGVTDVNAHIITHPEAVKLSKLPVALTKPATAPQPHILFLTGA